MQQIDTTPAMPVTRPGDVWLLGDHRLVCGDATDPATVALALAGAVPHLMVTDPPYGVNYDPSWRVKVAAKGSKLATGAVANDNQADWREVWALFPGDVAYVWHSALNGHVVRDSLEACRFLIWSQIIWDKGRLIISRGAYHWRHEPCWYAVRRGRTARWTGDRKQVTVWQIPHRRSETGHGTQKPLLAMQRPMENHSRLGDAVYDPFVGSGTTIIAAEMIGRRCHAIEIDPVYVDIAVRRWEAHTGLIARLAPLCAGRGRKGHQRGCLSRCACRNPGSFPGVPPPEGNAPPRLTSVSRIFSPGFMFMSDPDKQGRVVNRAELATLCNISLPTVDTWVRKGCPSIERGSKGHEWRFDSAAVIDWRIKTAVDDAVSGLQDGDGKVSKDEADRRKAVASAIVAEVEADEALKAVVSRFDAESVMADFCQALRSGMSNAGSKIAGRTATMTNPNEIRELCEAEINRAFQVAEADLAERWAGGSDSSSDNGPDEV